jgi:segregation and condensation protein B
MNEEIIETEVAPETDVAPETEPEPEPESASEPKTEPATEPETAPDSATEHEEIALLPAALEIEVAEELMVEAPEDELFMTDENATSEDHAEAAESILGVHPESAIADDSLIEVAPPSEEFTATHEELKPVIEALLFVAEEPLSVKQLVKVLGEIPDSDVQTALEELVKDYDAREGGLEIREIAGGWRISTRPQHHDFIRKYLKSRPTAKLSLPALETLAVIAYKQPITIPEILEIRGVSSSSAIKTLLEKRLIVTKGRKETVGRPMMYGTSKDFMLQFGLRDLGELPSIEDFEDLAQ